MFEYLLACCKKVALMYVWMDGCMDGWMDGVSSYESRGGGGGQVKSAGSEELLVRRPLGGVLRRVETETGTASV